jgi:PTH1 family peptidyl-tRNA hydrolase
VKLIVGLGNPGIIYANSRHNIGFSVIKALKREFKARLKKEKGILALCGRIKIGQHNVIIAAPTTFMNLSGDAVIQLIKRYKVDLENMLVVCDDLDLEFGRLKLKPSGSSGGHRGLESVIYALNCQAFPRLRIGIGRPHKTIDSTGFVLSAFTGHEKARLQQILKGAVECCEIWASEGISRAMNIFNTTPNACITLGGEE